MFFLTMILALFFFSHAGRSLYRFTRGYRYAKFATRLLEAAPRGR
jgi:hypothetical protein